VVRIANARAAESGGTDPYQGGESGRNPRLATAPSVASFRLGRGAHALETPIARWAKAVARGCEVPIDAVGIGRELEGDALHELQSRTNSAFTRPVYRITLHAPLLAYRFYGDLCVQVTLLYTSLATVVQVPGYGRVARELLGLTGRNGADRLVAVRIEPGSLIATGGISNRAVWADQILVEHNRGIAVVADVALADLYREA